MSGLGKCKICGNILVSFNYNVTAAKKTYELQGIKCSSSSCDYKMPSEAKEKIRMTIEIANKSIGKKVLYRPYKDCSEELYEYGIITSVDRNVYIRYGEESISKATYVEDIELI
jgi:hypothetical protein